MRKKMLMGSLITGAVLGLGWLAAGVGELRAEDDEEHGQSHEHERGETDGGWAAPAAGPGGDSYTSECGSCHVPYPPSLLGAKQWAVIMARLNNHYGESAEMTPDSARALGAHLQANAGWDDGPGAWTSVEDLPRITTSAWFRDEHDEIGPEVWKRASIGSAANCGACHRGAERGVYEEEEVRVPR